MRHIAAAIHWYVEEFGYAPTNRELMAICGLSSSSVASYWITRMEGAGLLTRRRDLARTLRLTEAGLVLVKGEAA